MKRALLSLGLMSLGSLAQADSPQVELGLEGFLYRTATTPLNRNNLLGLDSSEELLRGALGVKQAWGSARVVARGYLEQRLGSQPETTARLRQGYVQYSFGDGLTLRLGKQRIAWGSGFAWNPSNRLEPAKNRLNPGLEQEGNWAVRMDLTPAAWAGLILVAVRDPDAPAEVGFEAKGRTRRAGAVRARFLVKDTDLALVFSGGTRTPSLVGVDVGRSLGGATSVHAEAAFSRGAELLPERRDQLFFRLATGLLYVRGEGTSVSLEYFWNGEGYRDDQMATYRSSLDGLFAQAQDPGLPASARAAARDAYLAASAVPYSGGLGLRRHYLQGSWSRASSDGKWTTAARGMVGLSDGGLALTPGLSFAPRGNLTMQLDAVVLLGPEGSEFRLAPLRGALQARVKVLF